MKLVKESLNEYVNSQEDKWADKQIRNWELEKQGINPLKKYIDTVIDMIWDQLDDNVLKQTGITKYIIEDLITADDEDLDIKMNVYNFWEDDKPEEVAAYELGLAIDNYIMDLGGLG